MPMSIHEIMTPHPMSLSVNASSMEAARIMGEADIGNVVVVDGQKVFGIVTDRDIVPRVIAEGRDPTATALRDICSHELTIPLPQDSVDDAVRLMRQKALRRLPVVGNKRPVGIVTIGDLALEKDPHSALGNISAAPANR